MSTISAIFGRRLAMLRQQPLVGNALALYAVQGLNYLMPLFLLPFLLRALQPQGYGAIMFAQSLLGYAAIVVEFGFNFTAAREISLARHDPVQVARIFWTTCAAKILLFLCTSLIVALIVIGVPGFRTKWPLFAASGLLLVGNILFPQWYFQGLERLKDVALLQAVAKCLVTLAAILLIHTPDDLVLAAIILASYQVVGSLAGFCLAKPLIPPRFHRPTLMEVFEALKRSSTLFVANIANTLYLNTNTFALGILSGETAVALYSVATRIVSAIQGLAAPLAQAVFPRASLLFSEDKAKGWKLIRRVLVIILPAIALVSGLVWIFAPLVVKLIGGLAYSAAVSTLRIMLIVPALVTLGMVLAQCVMVNIGLSGTLLRVYMIAGALNLVVMPVLVNSYAADGAAISLVIAEALIEILLVALLWKRKFPS